ncbi:hypothetical protein LguiB_021203 [Lonicera macranthoides]
MLIHASFAIESTPRSGSVSFNDDLSYKLRVVSHRKGGQRSPPPPPIANYPVHFKSPPPRPPPPPSPVT